jgi:competence protein ComEA
VPDVHVPRRTLLLGALALVLALVCADRFLREAGTASVAASPANAQAAAPAQAPVVVHVVGAVRRAGLYRLPQGSRIADAIARAAGATRRADLSLVNLAAPLADGMQVVVPRKVRPGAAGGAAEAEATTGPVHLNTATLEQLDVLPGIGPAMAQRIIDHREANGGFGSVEELTDVPGIGEVRMASLRDQVRV